MSDTVVFGEGLVRAVVWDGGEGFMGLWTCLMCGIARWASSTTPTEFACDAVGRRYQTRVVTDLNATKYNSGAFNY